VHLSYSSQQNKKYGDHLYSSWQPNRVESADQKSPAQAGGSIFQGAGIT